MHEFDPKEFNKILGGICHRYRKAKGLSHNQLVEKIGVSSPYITNFESGNRGTSVAKLIEFCEDGLGVKPEVVVSEAVSVYRRQRAGTS